MVSTMASAAVLLTDLPLTASYTVRSGTPLFSDMAERDSLFSLSRAGISIFAVACAVPLPTPGFDRAVYRLFR